MFNRFVALLALIASAPSLARDGAIDATYGFAQGVSLIQLAEPFETTFPRFVRSPLGKSWMIGDNRTVAGSLVTARFDTATGLPDLAYGNNSNGVKTIGMPAGFDFYSMASAIARPDGRLLLAGTGRVQPYVAGTMGIVCALNANGTLDLSFNATGCFGMRAFITNDEDCALTDVVQDASGRVLVVGYCETEGSKSFVARLTPSGNFDVEFAGGAGFKLFDQPIDGLSLHRASSVLVQSDGTLLMLATAEKPGPHKHIAVLRLDDGGSIDNTFGGNNNGYAFITGGPENDSFDDATAIMQRRDGRIVVAGQYSIPNEYGGLLLARLNANGTPDQGFGGGDGVERVPKDDNEEDANYETNFVRLDEQERIISGGYTHATGMANLAFDRLLPNGQRDPRFGSNGRRDYDFTAMLGEPNPMNNFTSGFDFVDGRILIGAVLWTSNFDYSVLLTRTENGDMFADSFE